MCEWGTHEPCLVPIHASLIHTDQFRSAIKGIDACIADVVNALNASGVYTMQCCCGHGEYDGTIELHDGRKLIISRWNED